MSLDKSIELEALQVELNELLCEQEELEECGDLEDQYDICWKIDRVQNKIAKLESQQV